MKEIFTKKVKNTYVLKGMVPISKEDVARLDSFKDHQILRNKVSGVLKERSVEQNAWIHAIFRFVADNTDDPGWNTETKVKKRVKYAIGFYDVFSVEGNRVFFEFRSFAFNKMEQWEANKVYNEAKGVCAQILGVDSSVLEAEAKQKAGLR